MSKYNEAQKRAAMKYMEANTERLTIRLPLGVKNRWNAAAQLAGLSLTKYLAQLVNEDMKKNGIDQIEDHTANDNQTEE